MFPIIIGINESLFILRRRFKHKESKNFFEDENKISDHERESSTQSQIKNSVYPAFFLFYFAYATQSAT